MRQSPEEEVCIPPDVTVERPAQWMTGSGLSSGYGGIRHSPVQTQFNATGQCGSRDGAC